MSGPGTVWQVIGGGDKGGIIVRAGQDTKSPALNRLSTGAFIEQLTLAGERLEYRKLSGTGPKTGWVSVKTPEKDLCIPTDKKAADVEDFPQGSVGPAPSGAPAVSLTMPEEPPVPAGAPRCLQPANQLAAPLKPNPVLPPVKKYPALKKLVEAAEKRCKGDMYGLNFPQTPEEMVGPDFGVDWMTRAFHAAGTLPEDNSVVNIENFRRFEGGGSGPKAIFDVTYASADENLDTKLFVKMPWPLWENQNQRYLESGQYKFGDNWGGEISFYRFFSPHLPYSCPKFYFGDLSRESTEAILINARVLWPEEGKTEFGAYEVLPICGKCEDYLLKDPQYYYAAVMRRLGTFTGLAKAKKLGPETDQINWYDCGPKNDVNCTPGMPGTEKSARTFIEQVAPHWFPPATKDPKFLDKFIERFAEVSTKASAIAEFLYEDPAYVGPCHQNGNTDNCYFYKREDGIVDAGILDWGSTAAMSFGSGFMGSTISGLGEMLATYDEALVQVWADAYHATGAPKLDFKELLLRYRLSTCISTYGIMASTNQYTSPKGLEQSKGNFAYLSAWNCDEIRANFGWKFSFGMLYNRILLFTLKGDFYWSAVSELSRRKGG